MFSIKKTLMLSFLAISIIPLIFLSFMAISISTEAITTKATDLSDKLIKKSVMNENLNAKQIESLINMITTDIKVPEVIFKKYEDPLTRLNEEKEVNDKLTTLAYSVSNVERVIITTKSGGLFTNGQSAELSDMIDLEAFKQSKEYQLSMENSSDIYWQGMSVKNNYRVVLYKAIVNTQSFQPEASIIIILKTSYIDDLYSQLAFHKVECYNFS